MSHAVCERYFRSKRVFTSAEFKAHLAEHAPERQHRYASILHYYRTQRRLCRIKKGLYAPVSEGAAHGKEQAVTGFLLAGKMTPDATLAYHTALEFHGCGYSVWNLSVYASRRPVKPLSRRTGRVKGVVFPKALRDRGAEFEETELCVGSHQTLRVTTLERALVDIVDRPWLCGEWDEVGRGYAAAGWWNGLDVERVMAYALSLQNAFTIAKTGFFLDLCREELGLDDGATEPLRPHAPRQPRYLDWRRRQRGPVARISKWNLIVPAWVQERAWNNA